MHKIKTVQEGRKGKYEEMLDKRNGSADDGSSGGSFRGRLRQ